MPSVVSDCERSVAWRVAIESRPEENKWVMFNIVAPADCNRWHCSSKTNVLQQNMSNFCSQYIIFLVVNKSYKDFSCVNN